MLQTTIFQNISQWLLPVVFAQTRTLLGDEIVLTMIEK